MKTSPASSQSHHRPTLACFPLLDWHLRFQYDQWTLDRAKRYPNLQPLQPLQVDDMGSCLDFQPSISMQVLSGSYTGAKSKSLSERRNPPGESGAAVHSPGPRCGNATVEARPLPPLRACHSGAGRILFFLFFSSSGNYLQRARLTSHHFTRSLHIPRAGRHRSAVSARAYLPTVSGQGLAGRK